MRFMHKNIDQTYDIIKSNSIQYTLQNIFIIIAREYITCYFQKCSNNIITK